MSTLSLSDQTKLRLNEINKKKEDYFEFEIKERDAVIKKLSKYTAARDYSDKTLIVLSATSGGISIIFFTNVIGISAGVISASLTLVFSLTTGIIKKLLKETRKKYDQMKENIRNKKDKKDFSENAYAGVHTITENKKLFWVKMIDVQKGLDLKNMPDLVKKEM